ncbi:MAG TPA: TIM barrel protein [Acidimicrobiales bacterium]|nr:TIM barrel protein [Acidimicrobiales bacterium]
MIRFGGPILDPQAAAAGRSESHGAAVRDIASLVAAHVDRGYRAAYVPQVKREETSAVEEIRQRFAAADIVLAEVQCWNNLLDPDPAARRANREEVVEALALAEELGAVCAVDTVGSFAAESLNHHHPANYSQEAFDAAVENARYIIDSVEPGRSRFAYEVLSMHLLDEPEVIERLVHAVDRTQFGVHLDLVNLVNSPRKYWNTGELARECARRFGGHIVAAHAKDIVLEDNCDTVRMSESRPGTGNLDYRAYLRCLDGLPQTVTLLMEHLTSTEEYAMAAAYIRGEAAAAGVEL